MKGNWLDATAIDDLALLRHILALIQFHRDQTGEFPSALQLRALLMAHRASE